MKKILLDQINICASLDQQTFKNFQRHKKDNALVCKEEGCYLVSRNCNIRNKDNSVIHPTVKDRKFLLTNEQVDRIMSEGAFLIERDGEFFLAEIAMGKVFRVDPLKFLCSTIGKV